MIQLRSNNSLMKNDSVPEAVEAWKRNSFGRESRVGWIIRGEDDNHHFMKAPFTLLEQSDEEDICYICKDIDG